MTTNFFLKDGIPTVSAKDIEGMKEVNLIDVRSPDEYVGELGHINGSRLVTLGPELDGFLATANKQSPIIFICRSGVRSGKATTQAMGLGFKNIFNMEGGMLAWNSLALPISKKMDG
jgi:rhodanese-related sulfurtransferase